jgi:hypothetical protein
MQDQPKYPPLRPSDFFADGRPLVPSPKALSRGHLDADRLFYTGKGPDGARKPVSDARH